MKTINYENQQLTNELFDLIDKGFMHCELIYDSEGKPVDFRFLNVNSVYEAHSGLKPSFMIGKTVKETFPGIEKVWIDQFASAVIDKKPCKFTEYNHNIGKHYRTHCFSPVENQFIAVFEDVSHEIGVEEKLKQTLKDYMQIFESMTDMFMVIELVYDKNNKAVDWYYRQVNPAHEKLVNKSKSEMIGQTAKTLFGTVEDYWLETYDMVDKSGTAIRFENYSKHVNKYFNILAWKIRPHTIAVLFSDVTERIIKEEFINNQNKKLRKAEEKAKENEALKSALLSNMSHEIRTPLNAILGFSSLLNRENISIEQRKKYVDLIQLGGSRLLRILTDVADMSKLDTKQFSLIYDSCNLNTLIRNLVAQFKLTADQVHNHIEVDFGLGDSESELLTDETRLMQIFSNLIVNALRYTKNGTITIGYVLEGDTLQLFVKDTGIGIAKKHHKTIFDRFVQVKNSNCSGTGLGLSIIKEIIELMAGEIWVESAKGQGAEFYFNLPYLKGLNANINLAKGVKKDVKKENPTILIAEDEHINFLYLEALFEDLPFNVIHAKNGLEAVEMATKHPNISMIFMDLRMPKKNGAQAVKDIRKTKSKIPIIALTACAMEDDNKKLLNEGFDALLTKPFSKDEITTLIKKHL
jgi:signal transduction histidine kinase/CheY-like chemotaxis protein